MKLTKTIFTIATVALIPLVASCSSPVNTDVPQVPLPTSTYELPDLEDVSDTASSSASATPSTAPSATDAPAAEAPAAAPAGEFTAPGTVFAFGQQGTFAEAYLKDKPGVIGVSVTGITKGTQTDLAELDLGDKAAGMTPFFVKVTFTNVDGSNQSYAAYDGGIGAYYGDGTGASKVYMMGGKWDKCTGISAPKDFNTVGATYDTCLVFVASGDAEVVSAAWQGTDSSLDNPLGRVDGNPVLWK